MLDPIRSQSWSSFCHERGVELPRLRPSLLRLGFGLLHGTGALASAILVLWLLVQGEMQGAGALSEPWAVLGAAAIVYFALSLMGLSRVMSRKSPEQEARTALIDAVGLLVVAFLTHVALRLSATPGLVLGLSGWLSLAMFFAMAHRLLGTGVAIFLVPQAFPRAPADPD